MAFNIIDTSYSGSYASYLIMRATYGMDTVRKGVINIAGGIKKQHTIGRLDYLKPLKPRMAEPTTTNQNPFEIDGRLLIPKSVDVYEEFNPRDLEEHYLAEQLSTTILDRQVPQGLQSQMVQLVLNRAGEAYENLIWMGSLDYAGGAVPTTDTRYQLQFMDGLMKRLVNDPLVNLSTISPVTITTSNIASILDNLISECAKKEKGLITDPMRFQRMKFVCSPVTEEIYMEMLRTGTTFKGNPFESGVTPRWGNYEVVSVAGMPDNTIIFCRATDDISSNLWAGMNSMNDWELKLQRKANNSELFFIQGKWKWDVNYGWGQEIFMYTTLTAADFQV